MLDVGCGLLDAGVRGMLTRTTMPTRRVADFNLRALYDAIEAERQQRGLSWAQTMRAISRFVGRVPGTRAVSRSTVEGLRTRAVAEADGVLQMLRWLQRTPESFVPGSQAFWAHVLPRIPDDQILRMDTKRLHAALNAQREARSLTWPQVARDIGGVSAAQLTHLAEGGRTTFPLVMRITGWLNQPVAAFTLGSTH